VSRQGRAGADRWGGVATVWGQYGQTSLIPIRNLNDSNIFKFFQTLTNPKSTFSFSKKIEIKYGFEWFEETNKFLHRNFFIFEVDFD
jgi:hypothetical protein